MGAEAIIKSNEIAAHLDNYSKKIHELSDSDWCSERYKQWKTPLDQKRKKEYEKLKKEFEVPKEAEDRFNEHDVKIEPLK